MTQEYVNTGKCLIIPYQLMGDARIVGGACRDTLIGSGVSDYDVLVEDEESFALNLEVLSDNDLEIDGMEECNWDKQYEFKVCKLKKNGLKYDLIYFSKKDGDPVDRFDFTMNCCWCKADGLVMARKDALEDINNRLLRKNRGMSFDRLLYRTARFTKRGWLPTKDLMNLIYKNIESAVEHPKSLKGTKYVNAQFDSYSDTLYFVKEDLYKDLFELLSDEELSIFLLRVKSDMLKQKILEEMKKRQAWDKKSRLRKLFQNRPWMKRRKHSEEDNPIIEACEAGRELDIAP
jgi:hypothetical protein